VREFGGLVRGGRENYSPYIGEVSNFAVLYKINRKMPTLKKYSDFRSLKTDSSPERKAAPQYAAQRNDAWMAFLKALQQAKITTSINHLGNGNKLLK
jgi:hypothetical protein